MKTKTLLMTTQCTRSVRQLTRLLDFPPDLTPSLLSGSSSSPSFLILFLTIILNKFNVLSLLKCAGHQYITKGNQQRLHHIHTAGLINIFLSMEYLKRHFGFSRHKNKVCKSCDIKRSFFYTIVVETLCKPRTKAQIFDHSVKNITFRILALAL